MWTLIKLYFYLSPFLFLLLVTKLKFSNKIVQVKYNFLIIILLSIFPIYKYSINNDGIGRLDSFPSIINHKLKTNFKWGLKNLNLKKCNTIYINSEDYFQKAYLILKFNHNDLDIRFIDNNSQTIAKNECIIKTDNKEFYVE